MAKEYKITVPLLNIQPANQIIDYLNGNASLAIVNPYFKLPGVPQVPYQQFLNIKPLTGNFKGNQIITPQIVYKTQNGTFTSNIVFTDDNTDNSTFSTPLRFYPLFQKDTTLAEYIKSFKVLQKVIASRGTVKETNAQLVNECVVNYQLSQAFELLLMLKMISILPDPNDTDKTILGKIIEYFSNCINNPQIIQEITNRINDYLAFNTPPQQGVEDKRYIESYNRELFNMKYQFDKPVFQSIIDIFARAIVFKASILNKNPTQNDNYEKIFMAYCQVISSSKFQHINPACYVKEYSGKKDGNDYKGKSFYTEYTLKIADKSSSKTLIQYPGIQRRIMTIQDFLNLVCDGTTTKSEDAKPKSILSKIFMTIDFDYRVYGDKPAIGVRYVVHALFYKPNESNIIDNIDFGGIDMPGMEFGESGGVAIDYSVGGNNNGNSNGNINQQGIPTVDYSAGQFM